MREAIMSSKATYVKPSKTLWCTLRGHLKMKHVKFH